MNVINKIINVFTGQQPANLHQPSMRDLSSDHLDAIPKSGSYKELRPEPVSRFEDGTWHKSPKVRSKEELAELPTSGSRKAELTAKPVNRFASGLWSGQAAKKKTPPPAPQKANWDPSRHPNYVGHFDSGDLIKKLIVPVCEIATKDERATLVGLQQKERTLHQLLMRICADDAIQKFKRQPGEFLDLAKLQPENESEFLNRKLWTKDELLIEFQAKRKALKTAIREVGANAKIIATKIAARIQDKAKELASELEAKEVTEFAEFGMPHRAGPRLIALSYLTWRPSEIVEGSTDSTPPKSLLDQLGIDLTAK